MKKMILIGCVLLVPLAQADDSLITATGWGTVDIATAINETQAKMLAKRAAKLDAQRQLSEIIRGVQLTGGTTVEDYEVTSDLVATRVQGLLRGAFEVESKIDRESNSFVAEVVLGVCADNHSKHCKGKDSINKIAQTMR